MVQRSNILNLEEKYINSFSKYGFFDSDKLNKCFERLSEVFFPYSKCFIGGYLDRRVSNDMSLFIGNMSRDAMIMLFDDSTFSSDEKISESISFGSKSLSKILADFDKYSIRKEENLGQGIYYFNHKTGVESRISFMPELEIVQSESNTIKTERKVQSYLLACENPLEKTIELLRNS